VFWWGTTTLSGGTATSRVVPTWTWPRSNKSKGVTGVSGVHRHGEGGALSGHRHWWGGATTTFFLESRGCWRWARPRSPPPYGGARQFLSRDWCFRAVGWVVTTTPGVVPSPPYPVTTTSQASRWIRPWGGTTNPRLCHHCHVR
jgi:hypothetical protein